MTHQKNLPSKMKILIVDDDKKLCRLVEDYLEPMGYEVEAAHNGAQGLQMILGGDYHAVILDVMMPHMDGFEVLKRLRKESNIPVLMLTRGVRRPTESWGLRWGPMIISPRPSPRVSFWHAFAPLLADISYPNARLHLQLRIRS